MTLEEFRIRHSTLIEHYQFIENHLEGIYAAISGKAILDGLSDVEKDNIRRILKEIQKIEKDKNVSALTKDEYTSLGEMLARRNFWCHNCYYDIVFYKNGGPKNFEDIQKMNNDLIEAETWREKLYNIKMDLFKKNQSSLLPF